MKAEDVRLTQLFEGPKQFIVPVFQRDYSWGTKQCLQLWKDIVRAGSDENTKAHFVGSVVYVAAEETSAKITRWLLIDGQKRLTTVTLLLTAMRTRMRSDDDDEAINRQGTKTQYQQGLNWKITTFGTRTGRATADTSSICVAPTRKP